MQQLVRSQRFALVELILVVICGAIWMIKPEWGIWFILIALLPLAFRAFGGEFQFKPIDWLVFVFVLTAWAGYWAAYDETAAWSKVWLIVSASLLYYALSTQPGHNLIWVSVFLFCLGVGVSIYYFLTHDFVSLPRKLEIVNQLGRSIMSFRPVSGWAPIHPNYVAGMIAITIPFIGYIVQVYKNRNTPIPIILSMAVSAGLGISVLALFMATSRGVLLAIVSGMGGWLLWRAINLTGIRRRIKVELVFPVILLIYLLMILVFLFVGPARGGNLFSDGYYFGNGSRAELISRSFYLLLDYPITGGGLGSFPGLYSQYLLGIPHFNVANSHNLFLDVGIEQGLIGGAAFLSLYIGGLWTASRAITKEDENQTFKWVVLFSLIVAFIHGMVDNYLYNGSGSVLSLYLIGLSMNGRRQDRNTRENYMNLRNVVVIFATLSLVVFVNFDKIRGIWYANLGAVELDKIELEGFPETGWIGFEIESHFDEAETSLRTSLHFDPINRTANQRLGLISMYRKEFLPAARSLKIALDQAPNHRGIIKSLGYCYVWLGDLDKAQEFLVQIPEAGEELDVYAWWWETQGRNDLSGNAILALEALNTANLQP